ncbi:MAG TPA: hypothetical protein VE549_10460 [Myxococcaceae bacterium]|nr:hypothetical protein [Myxococcaceae bacterium]
MSDSSLLVKRFAAAGLELEFASAPLLWPGQGESKEVFQLDVSRPNRHERFRLWSGHRENRFEVEGVDRTLQQLVMMVQEPRRRFEIEVSPWVELGPGTRVLRRNGRRRWIEQWTDPRKRHFLCGMDEAHYFNAQLPFGVSTVRGAHEILRAPELALVERHAPARTIRQGEWFFVAISHEEEAEVARYAAKNLVQRSIGLAEAARIARPGRPHRADEVLVMRLPRHPEVLRIYARGRVRHADHEPVVFKHWRRVIPNNEPRAQPFGVRWID